MTAQEILKWFDLQQGTAKKSHIRKIWHHFPEHDHASSCVPGLPEGQHFGLYAALIAAGCKE